ncbi:MAG: stage II sporulation protein P [Clostridia bacterium]|nr:stage II sporulation protein P [Clostridia bacterium]
MGISAVAPAFVFAVDGEIIQYEVYDEYGDMLTYSSDVEIGDTILTKDFSEYQIYRIEGEKCYARFLRKLNRPIIKKGKVKDTTSTEDKKLCLYMTHNDESYTPSDGYDSIYGAGGIHDVAKALEKQFEARGIQVVLDESLHIPHDSSAYSRSAVTAKTLYNSEKPDALFDIHRDGVSRKYYYASHNGEEYSKIRIVVGKSNPNFEKNYKFAQEVFAVGNELYPWLFLDIYCGKGHYNQEIMSTNLLFEMGTYLIEKELVLKSVPLLAETVEQTMYASIVEDEGGVDQPKEDIVDNEVEEEAKDDVAQTEQTNDAGKPGWTWLVVVSVMLGSLIIFAFATTLKKKIK